MCRTGDLCPLASTHHTRLTYVHIFIYFPVYFCMRMHMYESIYACMNTLACMYVSTLCRCVWRHVSLYISIYLPHQRWPDLIAGMRKFGKSPYRHICHFFRDVAVEEHVSALRNSIQHQITTLQKSLSSMLAKVLYPSVQSPVLPRLYHSYFRATSWFFSR